MNDHIVAILSPSSLELVLNALDLMHDAEHLRPDMQVEIEAVREQLGELFDRHLDARQLIDGRP